MDGQDRSKRILKLLKAGEYNPEECKETAVRDLLADLRHFCDCNNIDFANQDRIAYDNYSFERQETINAANQNRLINTQDPAFPEDEPIDALEGGLQDHPFSGTAGDY